MNDCPNAEIRDRLPDLLHGRLVASDRAVLMAHVAECGDCRAELELLRGLHETLVARTPRIDTNWVLAALPKPPAARPLVARSRNRSWADWRIAAAVTLLVAGGSSVAVYNRMGSSSSVQTIVADSGLPSQSPVINAVQPAPVASTKVPVAAETVALAQVTADGSDISDPIDNLDDAALDALVNEIDQLEAIPVTEPDPVSLRIGGGTSLDPSELGVSAGQRGGV